MGNCIEIKKDQVYGVNQKKSICFLIQVRPLEHQILHLMYQDLSSRSISKGITRQQFDVFFHLNGLWSSSIYKKFDKNKKGYISFDDFSQNLLIMTKGDFNRKSQILFGLYSQGQSSGVSFLMLTKMFYSYPKQEINRMVVDEKFLNTIDSYQLNCFFDEDQKIKDNFTLELAESFIAQQNERNATPSIDEVKKMGMEFMAHEKKLSLSSIPSAKQIIENRDQFLKTMPLKVKYSVELQIQTPEKRLRKNSYSIQKQVKRKHFKITSNLSFLVKKYVTFLFETYNVNVKQGSLNLENFRDLLKNHQKIFEIYLEGFHTYVWQYNDQGIPLHKTIKANFESEALQKVKAKRTPCYLILVKTTLFVYGSKDEEKPTKIINLEGLHVKQSQYVDNGLTFFHRDGIYPQHQFQLQNQQLKNEWMSHLSDFVKGNINDDFQFIEPVGTGKFAKVFYGKEKSTNQQVAIKMIEKNKLTKNEKLAIQKEFSILKLCHNPYIIKFYKHYETKNNLCIITQFIKEGDLFEYVKDKKFLEEYEAAIIFKQLLEAIQYLNELGLIHRDLKPQNIMVQLNDQKTQVKKVKLIDFGFAIYKKQLEIVQKNQKSVGTPGYIAPQILFGQDFDESADMFSLGNYVFNKGIILYFMLSGYLPFYSPIFQEIIEQTKLCNIILTNSHWSNISKPAKQLIKGLLTFKNQRLTLKQVMEHQWVKNIESLKQLNGINRKSKTKSKKYIE